MQSIILGLAVAGALVFGLYLADRMDRFRGKNRSVRVTGRAAGSKYNSSYSDESAEEIAEEVRSYLDSHNPEKVHIRLEDDSEIPKP